MFRRWLAALKRPASEADRRRDLETHFVRQTPGWPLDAAQVRPHADRAADDRRRREG